MKLTILATLGLPGSGKTHFSRYFAQEHGFVHLNSDQLRHEMFDDPKYIESESVQVFEQMEQRAHDSLLRGKSIVFDANAILKQYRDDLRAMAKKYDAQFLLMWFKSDIDQAMAGIKRREDITDEYLKQHHITMDEDVAKWLVANVGRRIEPPTQDEPYIELDAHQPYDVLTQQVEQALGIEHQGGALEAIIFDWHGVLDVTRWRHSIDKLSEITGKDPMEIRSEISDLMFPWNTGALSSDDFWAKVGRRLAITKEQVKESRSRTSSIHRNDDLWALLPELKKQYKLAILSNAGTHKVKFIQDNEDLQIFDEVRFSSDAGLDKSQDEFFLELTQTLDVQPHQALYIDDSTMHIEKAKSLGFQTYHFGDVQGLKNQLQ